MKLRNTTERWLADILQTPEAIRKADAKDRAIDKRASEQFRNMQNKTHLVDWRSMVKISNG